MALVINTTADGGNGGGGEHPVKRPAAVPEPGILALLGLGLACMTIIRRRKQV